MAVRDCAADGWNVYGAQRSQPVATGGRCSRPENGSQTVELGAAPPDVDGLRGLAERLACHRQPLQAAIESMNGARFVHDRLELYGWQVEIADALKVKGLAPLAYSSLSTGAST